MKTSLKSLVGALVLTAAAGGAFAQAVDPGNPFAGLPIDVATFDVSSASLAALGAVGLADLNARCDVIRDRPFYYGLRNAAFCDDVLIAQGILPNPRDAEDTFFEPDSSGYSDSSSDSVPFSDE